jgi:PAS domain S-box-containing protein
MNTTMITGINAAELRRRAEEIDREGIRKAPEFREAPSLKAASQLIQELRLYKIELEMQNKELVRTQFELEISRGKYFDLYDLAPVGYLTISENGLILEVNRTFVALLGVTEEVLLKQPLNRFIFCEDQDVFYLWRKRLYKTGLPRPQELRLLKKDGTQLWVRMDANLAQDFDGSAIVRAVISDIDEWKRAEEAMKATAERFSTGSAIRMIIDPRDGRIIDVNDAAMKFYGYSVDELKNLHIFDINISPINEAKEKPIKDDAVDAKPAIFQHRKKDGSIKLVEVYSSPIRMGSEVLLHSIIVDVSSREKMEKDLQIIAERLALVMEASGAGIWDRNLKTNKVFVDSQWKAMIGYKEYEMDYDEREWQSRKLPQDSSRFQQAVSDALKRKLNKFEVEHRIRHKDGSYRWIRTIGKITFDENRRPVRLTGSNVDITDKKKLVDLQLESGNRLKYFAQAVPDISFIIDEDGLFFEVFGADEGLLPFCKKNIRGRTVSDVYPVAMANKLMAEIRLSIDSNAVLRIEHIIEVAKGRLFFVGRVSPMHCTSEGKKLVAVVLQDFTERWKAESLLHASYQMRRKSDFLNDLVNGKIALDDVATDFATKLGLNFFHPMYCCIVSCNQPSSPDKKSKIVLSDMPNRKDMIIAAIGDEKDRIIWDCRDVIGIIYLEKEPVQDVKLRSVETAKLLQARIGEVDPTLEVLIGVGAVGEGTDGLRKSFQQASSALLATRSRAGKNGNISHYRDLGILQLLVQAGDSENSRDFVRATIGKIIDYDLEKRSEYLLTLEMILESSTLKDAAQGLFLHPNTLLFRKRRIEKLLNISLDDFETRVAVSAAVKLHKLSN